MQECPCGTNRPYQNCCGRFIAGDELPNTPEELMRSRYAAFTLTDMDYIANTMQPPASDGFNKETTREWASNLDWMRLEVIQTKMDSEQKGYVEFLAYFSDKGRRHAIHELSEFHRIKGVWCYVNGKTPAERPPFKEPVLARNALCPCGSGKKVKRCCGSINKIL